MIDFGIRDVRRFGGFMLTCVTDPKSAMERARSVGFTHLDLWGLIALASIARVLEAVILSGPLIALPFGERTVLATPLTFFLILSGGAVGTVFVLHYTAKMIGGTGDFAGALLTVALVEWLVVVLFGMQILVLFIVPSLIGIATSLALIVMTISLLNFINITEGFNSLLKALLTVVIGIVGVSFGVALIIVLIGGAGALQP